MLLVAALPGCAAAQRGDSISFEARHAADCRLAAQVLTTGEPAPRHSWAMRTIARCADQGPHTLARLWSSPPTDGAGLDELIRTTRHVRDQRILTALIASTERADVVPEARMAAIVLVATYAWPSFDYSWRMALDSAAINAGRGQGPGTVTDGYALMGTSPPSPDAAELARAAVKKSADRDPDARIRDAASRIAIYIERR
ncbi:MAG: hypothetical protein HOQ11_14470 [Gemmatimonadaceae bacterium]|nr:hypothetical protein [Gemmatimonadaceae bacterium]NUQ94350.1 hypothetical protein [Gemmatimonadaceae bacterium]NUS98606.1 hypothetical protein [Gemmatimonadaceae bacterium]